jgi:Flp pilus assembly protein TadB
MSPSSPRSLYLVRSASDRAPVAAGDRGVVLAAFAVLWLVSLARVAGALVHHEVFGGESTLALLALAGLPWLLWRARGQGRPGRR